MKRGEGEPKSFTECSPLVVECWIQSALKKRNEEAELKSERRRRGEGRKATAVWLGSALLAASTCHPTSSTEPL